MNAFTRLNRPPASERRRRPSRLRTALVAVALCALAPLGGCANMEFRFANTLSPAQAAQRYFNSHDPASPVNAWNAL